MTGLLIYGNCKPSFAGNDVTKKEGKINKKTSLCKMKLPPKKQCFYSSLINYAWNANYMIRGQYSTVYKKRMMKKLDY